MVWSFLHSRSIKIQDTPPLPADDPSITAAVRRLPPSPPVQTTPPIYCRRRSTSDLSLIRRAFPATSVLLLPQIRCLHTSSFPQICCSENKYWIGFSRLLPPSLHRRFLLHRRQLQIQRCFACCRLPLIFSSIFESRNLAGFLSFTGTDLPKFSTSPEWTAYFDAPVEVTCVCVHHCRSSTHRLFSNGLFSLKLRWDPHLIATVEAPQQSSSQDTLASSPPSWACLFAAIFSSNTVSCSHLRIFLVLSFGFSPR